VAKIQNFVRALDEHHMHRISGICKGQGAPYRQWVASQAKVGKKLLSKRKRGRQAKRRRSKSSGGRSTTSTKLPDPKRRCSKKTKPAVVSDEETTPADAGVSPVSGSAPAPRVGDAGVSPASGSALAPPGPKADNIDGDSCSKESDAEGEEEEEEEEEEEVVDTELEEISAVYTILGEDVKEHLPNACCKQCGAIFQPDDQVIFDTHSKDPFSHKGKCPVLDSLLPPAVPLAAADLRKTMKEEKEVRKALKRPAAAKGSPEGEDPDDELATELHERRGELAAPFAKSSPKYNVRYEPRMRDGSWARPYHQVIARVKDDEGKKLAKCFKMEVPNDCTDGKFLEILEIALELGVNWVKSQMK
jgi:hypothetical protein